MAVCHCLLANQWEVFFVSVAWQKSQKIPGSHRQTGLLQFVGIEKPVVYHGVNRYGSLYGDKIFLKWGLPKHLFCVKIKKEQMFEYKAGE